MKNLRRLLLFALAMICLQFSFAQTFNGTGGTIPNIGNASFPINVTGVGAIDGTYGVSSVCVNINHNTPNEDLEIILVAPDGTNAPLSIQNGTGNNFINTCFSASATTSIHNGTAPFTGTYIPDSYLGSVNNGQNADGTWRLLVNDRRNNSGTGTLLNWSITFSGTPAPPAPVLPPCTVTLSSGTSCVNAPMICDFSGLCGNTTGTAVDTWTSSNLNSCFGLENNSFLKFVATGTSATFSVWVPTYNAGVYLNSGIQILIFSGTCGSGAVTSLGCYPHILPYTDAAHPVVNIVTATGLVAGNTYYLMVDGFAGDRCNFVIETTQTLNQVDVNPVAPSICQGNSVTLTASGGGGVYNWTPPTGLSATTGATVTANPSSTTTYTVTSVMSGVCPASKNVTVTVDANPTISTQPTTGTTSVCQNVPIIPISVLGATATGTVSYQWYSNIVASNSGGTLLTGATTPFVTPQSAVPGTLYYYCVVSNSAGCSITSNVSGPVTVKPLPADPVLAITQPITCASPTATVTVQSPLGVSYQYSSGGPYQSSPVFSGLGVGTVFFAVKDLVTGCSSNGVSINITGSGGSAAPTVTVSQPGCGQITGSVVVTAPLGANYQYSNGGAYQASPNFNNMAIGNYSVTVKDLNTGCISAATAVTINPGPATPTMPNAFASHQPDCTNTSGTIVISSPINANHEYALNGNYQSTPTFTGLTPGIYTVTVRNIITGCESATANIFITNIPPPPPLAVVTINNQPTCAVPTGSFTITAPVGTYTYSIGGPFQSSTTFAGLAPGNYSITVKDANNCQSISNPVTINPPTGAPAAPTASVSQTPTCILLTGTITVSAPAGANIEYSIGTGYQASPIFAALSTGTYQVTAMNTSTGCISAGTSVTINAATAPAAPAASATQQPTCTVPTGTIVVSSPLGANYQYSNGGAYQTNVNFTNLSSATYQITVQDNNTGCISSATPVQINSVPTPPTAPTFSITQPVDCASTGGDILFNTMAGVEYGVDGIYQASTSFLNVAPGNHSLTVRDLVTGCVSSIVTATINNIPNPPAAPVYVINTQPTCVNNVGSVTITNPAAGVQYGLDGSYQASPNFNGLAPGTYQLTTKNIPTGCISLSASVTINPPPGAPATPVFTITQQPTCADPTGAIDITSPIGANLTFSIGGAYQASPIFSGLAPGTYSVTTKDNGSGCISSASSLVINNVPAAPFAASTTTQQPTCANPQGIITITAPIGATYSYSIGGSYQTGAIFNVVSGSYQLTVKDNLTGCISSAVTINVSPVTGAPPAPTVGSIQQPNCVQNLGSFTITAPLGANLNYSIGGTYQGQPSFNALSPGSYNVTVKDIVTGCVSNVTPVVINPLPTPPAAPSLTLTNPSCISSTGAIQVSNPLGSNLLYSIGGSYQTNALFSGVNPGSYFITVKDNNTGCISAATFVVMAASPNTPTPPLATGATRCGPGNITLTATGTGAIHWYSDAGLTNEIFVGNTLNTTLLNTTTYYLTADNGGCVSQPSTVQAAVLASPKPFLGNDTLICPGDKIILSTGNYANYTWSDGSHGSTFPVTVEGNYGVTVTDAAGCTGSDNITITAAGNCTVVYFVKAFTPNGDFLNDGFGPLPKSIYSKLSDYRLSVYNRYGQMVFSSNDPWQQWDGSFGGLYTPGAFTWYCTYKFGGVLRTQKGTVIVLK